MVPVGLAPPLRVALSWIRAPTAAVVGEAVVRMPGVVGWMTTASAPHALATGALFTSPLYLAIQL